MSKSSLLPFRFPAALNCLVLLFSAALSASSLAAQCPDGSEPDALGCPSSQSGSSSAPVSGPETLNVEQRPRDRTPAADRSNEASANGSLNNGASFSEGATRKQFHESNSHAIAVEPPTEFQNFVAATTGQMLPIYGASFFTTQRASFGPADRGPASAETIVSADDELRIRIWGQVNFSANLRVSREGEIYLPKVGAVHVAGLPFSSLPSHLKSFMDRVYRNYEISVDLGEVHSIQIYLAGRARQPGEYTVSAFSTLVDALFACGGPSTAGSMRHLQLKRAGKTLTDFDLYALLVNGDKSGDVPLEPGDLLYIPSTGAQVAVLGSVRQPGIYELRDDETLAQLLDSAGGSTGTAGSTGISIDRIDGHARRSAIMAANDLAGLSTPLVDGDIVRIDPVLSDYRNTITLRGAVANPGHFLWHEGMRLSDLLPERDALLKRDYWWQRTKLGQPAAQFVAQSTSSPAAGTAAQLDSQYAAQSAAQFADSNMQPTPAGKPPAVQSPAAQTNWNQAVIERLDPTTMATTLIPFRLGKLVLEHDRSQDFELRAGDVVTIYDQQDIQLPKQEQTIYIELAGEFIHPGIYSASVDDTLPSVVARAGGLTGRAYIQASKFTRVSTQQSEQDLFNEYADRIEHQMQHDLRSLADRSSASGTPDADRVAALHRDEIERLRQARASGRIVLEVHPDGTGLSMLPNMRLEDGDRFVVPFVPETVQVVGAVFNPHAFLFTAQATVGQYLRLAGGVNREADRKRMFVLRADGSVVGQTGNKLTLNRGFARLRLYPGDAIVVPEKDFHPSALNQFMLWSQLMSQASLNALEISTLK